MTKRQRILKAAPKSVFTLIVFIFVFWFLIFAFPNVPNGMFTDEIRIGYVAWELSNGNFQNFVPPFFYKHYQYGFGALPVLLSVPIIKIFGLYEWTTRFASSFYAFLGLVISYYSLKLLRVRSALVTIIVVLLTPIFYFLSRTNFGHAHSFFAFQLGIIIYLYAAITKKHIYILNIISGIVFAFAALGNGIFIPLIPLYVLALCMMELFIAQDKVKSFKRLFFLGVGFLLIYSSIVIFHLTDPSANQRFKDKTTQNGIPYAEKFIKNYLKYFDVIFLTFDVEYLPTYKNVILRYMVQKNGILHMSTVLLTIICLIAVRKEKNLVHKLIIRSSIIWLLLTPLSDIATTPDNGQPYIYALYGIVFSLPFTISYSLDYLYTSLTQTEKYNLNYWWKYIFFLSVIIAFLVQTVCFLNEYKKYPIYSSGYWGWQWGPKEIISYYKSQENKYDEMYIEPYFNDTTNYLGFYNQEFDCKKCRLGFLDNYDPLKKQLFTVRIESYLQQPIYQTFNVKKVFSYPQHNPLFVTFDNTNFQGEVKK